MGPPGILSRSGVRTASAITEVLVEFHGSKTSSGKLMQLLDIVGTVVRLFIDSRTHQNGTHLIILTGAFVESVK